MYLWDVCDVWLYLISSQNDWFSNGYSICSKLNSLLMCKFCNRSRSEKAAIVL